MPLCHCAIHSCFLATGPPCALSNYVSIISLSFKQFFGVIGRENAKPHLIYSVEAPNPLKAITQYTLKFNLLAYAHASVSPRVGLVVSDLKRITKQPNTTEASKHVFWSVQRLYGRSHPVNCCYTFQNSTND